MKTIAFRDYELAMRVQEIITSKYQDLDTEIEDVSEKDIYLHISHEDHDLLIHLAGYACGLRDAGEGILKP